MSRLLLVPLLAVAVTVFATILLLSPTARREWAKHVRGLA